MDSLIISDKSTFNKESSSDLEIEVEIKKSIISYAMV
jgi:hypothetical protein